MDVNSDPRFFASLRMTTALQTSDRSPRIDHVSWGRLEVEGKAEPYKDAKLFPGGSREWNWRDTGTAHRPGIQIADVQELLDHGAKVVVLSRGMAECLYVPRETLEFLAAANRRPRVADAARCGGLQQARANRAGCRPVPYDLLMVGRATPVRADGLERLGVQRTARPTSARMFVR